MIASIKETTQDLYFFLKNPTDKKGPDQKIGDKIAQLFSVLVLDIVLIIVIIAPLFEILEQTRWVDVENHALTKSMNELPVWLFLFFGAILAPVLEELIFRTLLTFKRNYAIKLMIAGTGVGGKRIKAKVNSYVKRKWRAWYRGTFYLVAIFFAYVHITNFELSATILLLSPLLVLPQFLAGLLLGYIRVRLGLLWSIYLHSLHNFILIGIALWFMHQSVEKRNLKTDTYQIKIEEAPIKGSDKTFMAKGASTVTYERINLEDILQSLLNKNKKLVEFGDPAKADLLLNIQFTQWVDTLDREKIILDHLQEVYEFKINREKRYIPFFDLALSDSLLLQKHKSKLPDTVRNFHTNVRTSPDGLFLENANTDHLLQNLNKTYDQLIVSENGFPGFYSFMIPPTNFEDLNQFFQVNYGLNLIQKEKDFEYVVVEF